MVFSGREGITLVFFVFVDQMCTTLLICISNHAFLVCFKYINAYECYIINILLTVCTEKYRTSIFLFKPRPMGSVCTKITRPDISLYRPRVLLIRCICMCFWNFYRINVSWRLEVDQRTNTSVLVGRCVGFLRFRRIGSLFIQQRKNILTIFFLYVDYEYTLIFSRLIIDTNINWMTKRINFTALRPTLVIIVKSTITYNYLPARLLRN